MAYSVSGNNIKMTRGDTVKLLVHMLRKNNVSYIPAEGDRIRFRCKKHLSDRKYILVKYVPTDSQLLTIDPEDTENLGYGIYYFDISLIYANGDVDTFIDNAVIEVVA